MIILFAMRHTLIPLLSGRKSGIMQENQYSYEVFHIQLIVDFKLHFQYTPKRSHNHIFVNWSLHEQ